MLSKDKSKWVMVLLALVLVALVVNVVIIRLMQTKASKPCLSIPTRFILEYPECAEKLVQAANVSNVRIVSFGALEGGTSDE